MNVLWQRIGGLWLMLGLSCGVCAVGCVLASVAIPWDQVLVPHVVVAIVGLLVLVLTNQRQVTYELILLTTALRTGGAVLAAGLLLGLFPELRTKITVLSLAVAYLAALTYETWIQSSELKSTAAQTQSQSRNPSPPVG